MPRLQTLLTSFLLALGLALGLAGCGGGGSSSSTPLNVSAGVYSGTVDGGQWLTVLLPDTVATNWYSLHYPTNNADLYSGKFSGVGSSVPSAATGELIYFPSNAKPLHSGSGSMSAPTSTSISTNLSILQAGTDPGKNVSASLNALTTTSRLADLQGTWTGEISHGNIAVIPNKDIVFSVNGNSGSAANFNFTSCAISNVTFTPSSQINVFNVSLQLAALDGCQFSEANPDVFTFTMTGIAVITSSPKTLYFFGHQNQRTQKRSGVFFQKYKLPIKFSELVSSH